MFLYNGNYKVIIVNRKVYKEHYLILIMPITEITKTGWRCIRCGHEWIPKQGFNKDEKPINCPSCYSARWDIPKKIKKENLK